MLGCGQIGQLCGGAHAVPVRGQIVQLRDGERECVGAFDGNIANFQSNFFCVWVIG